MNTPTTPNSKNFEAKRFHKPDFGECLQSRMRVTSNGIALAIHAIETEIPTEIRRINTPAVNSQLPVSRAFVQLAETALQQEVPVAPATTLAEARGEAPIAAPVAVPAVPAQTLEVLPANIYPPIPSESIQAPPAPEMPIHDNDVVLAGLRSQVDSIFTATNEAAMAAQGDPLITKSYLDEHPRVMGWTAADDAAVEHFVQQEAGNVTI